MPIMSETLCRIEAPHFVAGIIAMDGRVIRAAPILKYMLGWNGVAVRDYCRKKHWALQVVKSNKDQ
jgi:hypothetical protein